MSRNNRRISHGTMASSVMAVDRILDKQNSYKEAIVKNHTYSKNIAEVFFEVDGIMETTLMSACQDDDKLKQDLLETIQEQRTRMKKLSERNVENTRTVNAFVGALQQVKTQVQQQQQTQEESTTENEPLDYEKIIVQKMQDYRTSQQTSELDLKDEQYCREIVKSLGEVQQGASRNKNDDDDELQVLRNPNNATSLKCPIMGSLVEDPVKSKVCGHVYSRVGIMDLMRRRTKVACPVAGCHNSSLTKEQLEDDVETAMKVRRQRRREEQERQSRMTQELDLDDSEEEEM